MAVAVAHGCSEELCFLSDDIVGERQTGFLVVSRPVDERSLDVGEFAFGPFYGRSATIVLVEVFLLLTQNFRHSTKYRVSKGNDKCLKIKCCLPSLHTKHCWTQVSTSCIALGDRIELTSNLSLLDGRVILMILAHSPAI